MSEDPALAPAANTSASPLVANSIPLAAPHESLINAVNQQLSDHGPTAQALCFNCPHCGTSLPFRASQCPTCHQAVLEGSEGVGGVTQGRTSAVLCGSIAGSQPQSVPTMPSTHVSSPSFQAPLAEQPVQAPKPVSSMFSNKKKLSSGVPGKKKCPHCGQLSGVRSFKCSNGECAKPFYSDSELLAMPGREKAGSLAGSSISTFKVAVPSTARLSIPGCSKFKLDSNTQFSQPDKSLTPHNMSFAQPGLANCVQITVFEDSSQQVDFAPARPSSGKPKKRLLNEIGGKKCSQCGAVAGPRTLKCSCCSKPFHRNDVLAENPSLTKQRRTQPENMIDISDELDGLPPISSTSIPGALPTMLAPTLVPGMGGDVLN